MCYLMCCDLCKHEINEAEYDTVSICVVLKIVLNERGVDLK